MYSTSCQLLEKVSKLGFFMLILCNSLNRKLSKALCNLNNLLELLISIGKQTKNALNYGGGEEGNKQWAGSVTGVKSGKPCLPQGGHCLQLINSV